MPASTEKERDERCKNFLRRLANAGKAAADDHFEELPKSPDGGAQFEVTIDGVPPTYRNIQERASHAGKLLKAGILTVRPVVRDLRSDQRQILR